jgi:phosphoserine phosphatase RsbU/P
MTANVQDTLTDQPRVASLEAELRQEVVARKRLVEAALQLTSTFDRDQLLQLIMSSAAELLDAETSSLMLVDEATDELVITVASGVGTKAERHRFPAGSGIAGWTLANRQVAIIDDPASDRRFFPGVAEALQFTTRNLLAVPMLVKDRAIGVVEVINKRDDARFTERDAELATAFASLSAIAIDNAHLYSQLADAVVTARMSYRL